MRFKYLHTVSVFFEYLHALIQNLLSYPSRCAIEYTRAASLFGIIRLGRGIATPLVSFLGICLVSLKRRHTALHTLYLLIRQTAEVIGYTKRRGLGSRNSRREFVRHALLLRLRDFFFDENSPRLTMSGIPKAAYTAASDGGA